MIDISDVRIYGIGAIILILSMGYFVYLLYQDVVFIKKELDSYKSEELHSYDEDVEDPEENLEQESVDFDDEDDEEDENNSLESHLDSFMNSHENHHLHTIEELPEDDEELTECEPEIQEVIKKKRGRKPKNDLDNTNV